MPERTLLIVNGKSKILEAEVKRYIAVQYYYSKKDELAKDDPTVVNELTLYLGEQESIVSELIRKWRSLQFQGTFVMLNGIANAIILSAAADYRAALKKVKRNPKSKSAIDEALQIEKFFRSSWYQQLTSVDGEFLIRKLQDEIRQSE